MSPDDIVNKYLGGKYVYKGRLDGLDCYGLVWRIYKDIGIDIPDLSFSDDPKWHMKGLGLDIRKLSSIFEPVDEPNVYDVVAFYNPKGVVNHAGVYVGQGKFIHATSKTGVVVAHLYDKMWKDRLAGIYRHMGLK